MKNITIRNINRSDLYEINEYIEHVFANTGMSAKQLWSVIGDIDMRISIVATINDKIIGFYFLKEGGIPKSPFAKVNYNIFDGLRGVEGVALGVSPEYKDMGVEKKLIEYVQYNMDYDYIWGMQLKSLNNIHHWLKRRKMYLDLPHMYVTYQIF